MVGSKMRQGVFHPDIEQECRVVRMPRIFGAVAAAALLIALEGIWIGKLLWRAMPLALPGRFGAILTAFAKPPAAS